MKRFQCSHRNITLLWSTALVPWKKKLLSSVHITGCYCTSVTTEHLQLSLCFKCLNLAWHSYSWLATNLQLCILIIVSKLNFHTAIC